MPESFIGLPADSTGKKVHTRQRVIGANTVEEQWFLPGSERVSTAKIAVSTFRTPGLAVTPHNLFTLENLAANPATFLVGVRRLTIQMVATAATAALTTYRMWRTTTVPTGGTVMTKTSRDSADALNANVNARMAVSADAVATAITYALPATNPMWQQSQPVMLTSGVWNGDDNSLIPVIFQDDPLVIRPGQSILIAATTASVASASYVINCSWEEYTLP